MTEFALPVVAVDVIQADVFAPPTPAFAPADGAARRSASILIVDDDGELRVQIARYLTRHGHDVVEARDAAEMEAALAATEVDLIILDVMLPGEDGLSICRRISAATTIPIIMLSAMGEEADRVVGLEIGADDYLPKPCSPRELAARVKSVLRRRSLAPEARSGFGAATVAFDGFTLDLVRRKLCAPNGATIVLSTNEFAILAILLSHPGEVLSREALAGMGAIEQSGDLDRAIDMLVSRLRRKLRAHAPAELIQTERGRGYRLVAHTDAAAERALSTLVRSTAPQ